MRFRRSRLAPKSSPGSMADWDWDEGRLEGLQKVGAVADEAIYAVVEQAAHGRQVVHCPGVDSQAARVEGRDMWRGKQWISPGDGFRVDGRQKRLEGCIVQSVLAYRERERQQWIEGAEAVTALRA